MPLYNPPVSGGGTPDDNSVTSAKILDGTIVAGDLADLAVSARKMTDLARTGGWVPTGAIDQTIPDRIGVTANFTATSGTLYLASGVVIPGGRAVTSISFLSATVVAISPTNQWFCLVDKSLNVLATTVDDLTTAWGSNTVKTLNVATALGGATPGTYTPTNAIEVYVGVCQVAATPATLKVATTTTTVAAITPIQAASSTTGLTTPGSLGSTAGALTAIASFPFAWVN